MMAPIRWVLLAAAVFAPSASLALDPPHDPANGINCIDCHTPHAADGASITRADGNPNLCMTCHVPGGLADLRPFNDSDQALPGVSGTSHRWDSGPAGHVTVGSGNTSSGSVRSGGAFAGRIERRLTLVIAAAGDAGAATFDWSDDAGNAGTGLPTGDDIPVIDGLRLRFEDGPSTPSFVAGDAWTLDVRTDLRHPSFDDAFEKPMAQRLAGVERLPDRSFDTTWASIVCSACHDQHSQEGEPFDPLSPPFLGDGTGEGRHFQRQHNDANQMCKVCHSARDVDSAALGSHPVGVALPPGGAFQTPPSLPLGDLSQVECLSCHSPHYATSGAANGGLGDGYLLRDSMGEVCYECHTLADRATGSHLSTTSGVLWPGGQYGSSFPAHDAAKRGWCVNCHWPHGWPDDDAPASDYSRLWVERYDESPIPGADPDDAEDLCFTCHDGNPAATDIRTQFAKGTNGADIFHHPVTDSEQAPGRGVECVDCHNPHRARADNKLAGATGVDLFGDPVGPGTANDRDVVQAEVSNKRTDFQPGGSAYHPVMAPGKNQSANLAAQLLGGLTTSSTIECTDCHNNEATADVTGPASGSGQSPKGPHGSTFPTIRRAAYWSALRGPQEWNRNNFALCFLCHDPAKLVEARRFRDGAATNFYDDEDGKDNLHWVHLEDRADKSRAACKNCHYNVHANASATNTQYNVDGVVTTTPPPGVKTHLVSFSPDINPIGGRAQPEWRINTATRTRRCYLSCHGETMDGLVYRPDNGGDDIATSP